MFHDLQQPLAGIRALAAVPRSANGAREGIDELSERLRLIGELSEWMSQLVGSGFSSARTSERLVTTDAIDVVQDVLLAAAATFDGQLKWRPADSAPVPVGPVELRRAVDNVVANATRAAGPDGWVDVRVRSGRTSVCIEVEDSGPGFGRLRPKTQRGLRVTQAVLAQCGGTLEIGTGRSGGAVVRIEIPLAVADMSA
ncbi:MAG TPA: HAMP domain-containing sensor histidine kinase [Actinoplanes sp.]|nr:HAMP domain-containing sensor histidine kinase [Actinoplanes sp.]